MDALDLIVTHPGGAHKDDLLAVCVLLARHECPVERRDPTPEELANPRIATVDIGGEHAPERANFDHHHFPREHPPTCSLSLVLEALGLYQDALQHCDWLETAEWFDSRGPNNTADWLGVPRRAISRLSSPIDATLLRRFAAQPRHEPGELIHSLCGLVGEDLLGFLEGIRAQLADLATRVQPLTVPAGPEPLEGLFLPRADPIVEGASTALARYARAQGLDATLAALVYPDNRGPGFALARHEDHPRLDFTRIADEPDVTFAHANGFLAKTTATDPARLLELLAQAVLPEA